MISNANLQLIKDRPEFKELLKFLAEELQKLDTISDLDDKFSQDVVTIVWARKEAYKTLKAILEPLLDIPEPQVINRNEFDV